MPKITPIAAFDIFEDGTAKLAADTGSTRGKGAAWRWLHLDLADPGLGEWVAEHLDEIPANALTQAETRPRTDPHGRGLILNLRAVNMNPGSHSEDMVSLRIWATEALVVSARHRKVFAVDALRVRGLETGQLPASPGAFLAELAEGLTTRIDEASAGVEEDTDQIEETLLGGSDPLEGGIAPLRLRTIRFRRYIGPQREAMVRLATLESPVTDATSRAALRESANRTARSVEALDAARDRLTALQDHLDGLHASAMTRNANILSIVAAIFLPLGFLTGLFGMNVAGLPGVEWPGSFATLAIAMALIGVGLTALFRSMKWF